MRIAIIPGDGIGKEVTAEAVKVLNAVGELFGRHSSSSSCRGAPTTFSQTGITIPPDGYDTLRQFDAIFIGALGDPRMPDNRHARDILLGTRFELDLYVNYRPVKLLDERLCPLKDRGPTDVNFVVFRENTEGLYVSIGGRFKAGTEDEIAIQEEVNTFKGVHRIVRHAFEFAKIARPDEGLHGRQEQRHDSRATRSGSACSSEVAPQYPGIEATHYYIDALAMYMVLDPAQFEVIVTNNLFGDIVTDLGATFQGGLGMAASGNIHPGPDVDVRAGARLGAEVRREEHREPDRRDRVGGADAGDAGHDRRSRRRSMRRFCRRSKREPGHVGHRRHARNPRSRRFHRADRFELRRANGGSTEAHKATKITKIKQETSRLRAFVTSCSSQVGA